MIIMIKIILKIILIIIILIITIIIIIINIIMIIIIMNIFCAALIFIKNELAALGRVVSFEVCCQWALLSVQITRLSDTTLLFNLLNRSTFIFLSVKYIRLHPLHVLYISVCPSVAVLKETYAENSHLVLCLVDIKKSRY